jgi:hypothetical protein
MLKTFVSRAEYRKAYAQIVRISDKNTNTGVDAEYANDTVPDYDEQLSIDILAVDSVSWAQFQRDAVLSWPYMRDVMGVFGGCIGLWNEYLTIVTPFTHLQASTG